MNARERGFLLLTSHLGNPERRVLTVSQLRKLAQCFDPGSRLPQERELEKRDLMGLGYGPDMARRILSLLEEEALLDHYLSRGKALGCIPVTRVSEGYPLILRKRLGLDSPGCLWVKGDPELLEAPGISLVGSRELDLRNREFAAEAGRQAALQGLSLISGNARGADRAAQDAALEAGGRVVSILADALHSQSPRERVLYVSEDSFDLPFSAQRALSRNRLIHALGRVSFVAQCTPGKGGTWDGACKNLQNGWSPLACFRDGSEAAALLEEMGAFPVGMEDLRDLTALAQLKTGFL